MTQHIIDTHELEKLQQYVMIDMTNGVEQCKHGDYVHIDDLRALIANSPQADGMVLDDSKIREIFNLWRHLQETPKGLYARFKRAECEMLSAYKPQADDVRKDADTIALEISRNIMREIQTHTIPVDIQRMPQLQAKIQVAISEAIDKARE